MDYLNFNNWKNSHATEMQDLTFARPDDIFIFTRCTSYFPFEWEGKEVLYAESIEEVIGYIRHIFLYDILNDLFDDLEYDNDINKQILLVACRQQFFCKRNIIRKYISTS